MKYTEEQLERMIKSKLWEDRAKVARQGYRLDVLIKDKNWVVRQAVAIQGYGLERLINDEDDDVKTVALNKLQELVKQGKAKITVEIFE